MVFNNALHNRQTQAVSAFGSAFLSVKALKDLQLLIRGNA